MATDDAPNLRRLARQLVDVTRRLKHLETVPQLSNSSLDNQGMHVYDAEGNVSVTLGKQSDGTYSARPVAGPTPPAPVGLDAEGDAGLIHASWQGVFWAGAAMPRDFEAVEVLVDGNVQGAIHDPDGGSVTVPAFAGERVVSFRTLSQAGRRSDATGHVTVTVQSKASVQLDEARGRIEDAEGDLAGAQARINTALNAEGHIREDEILRNATLLGDTVVEQINVTDKLIGTDGVFTGTVDFENVNVTGELLASEISGEHIYGTVIEGGLFKTSDALPGKVELADDAYVTHLDGGGTYPGLRIVPIDTSETNLPAAIGPSEFGLTIFGGRNTSGGSSVVQCNPTAAFLKAFRTGGGEGGVVQTTPTASLLRTYREDGSVGGVVQTSPTASLLRTQSGNSSESGWVRVQPRDAELAYVDANNTYFSRIKADANEAYLYTRAGGSARYLSVDANGVWVKRQRGDVSGQWDTFNLLGDDWGEVTLSPAWAPRATGGYFGGLRVRRLGGSLEINGAVQGGPSGSRIGTIVDTNLRPKYDTFVVTTLASGGLGQAFVGSNGDIMHSYGADKPGFLAINVSIPLN